MSKVKIMDKKSEKSILGERELLSKLKHPFLVNMICSFQDYENLYLVMDLLTGGDLRYNFNQAKKFSENQTKFFVSCIILGLENIHENNIIHRDLKPENLVCDDKGYVRITDFGVAKIFKKENNADTSGTPGYMAPEVLMAQNHSFAVDFFAIGVICHEFLLGKRPYIGKNRKEIKQLILSKEIILEKSDNNNLSEECIDFINKCLKRKDKERIGYALGIKELKNHSWFKNCDWEKLYRKELIAMYIPKKEGNYDKKYCESVDKISNQTFERYKSYMKNKNYSKIFEGYTYFNYEPNICNTIENETRVSTSTKLNIHDMTDSNMTNSNINIEKNIIICPNKNEKLPSVLSKLKRNMTIKKINIKNNFEKNNDANIIKINEITNNNDNPKIKINDEKSTQLNNNKLIHNHIINDSNIKVQENNNSRNILIFNNVNINSNDINANNLKKRNISCSDVSQKILVNPLINVASSIQNQIKTIKNNMSSMNNTKTIDFKNFKPKKLNIHSFSSETFHKKETTKNNLNEINVNTNNKIAPVHLPPLSKLKKSSPIILNFHHFRFNLINKKKIKFISFKNKIIENHATGSQESLRPINQVVNDCPQFGNINIIKRNNDMNIKTIYNNGITGNQKFEIFGKSLSTANMGNFPKIKKLK